MKISRTLFDGGATAIVLLAALVALTSRQPGFVALEDEVWKVRGKTPEKLAVTADYGLQVSGVGRQGLFRSLDGKRFTFVKNETVLEFDAKTGEVAEIFTPPLSHDRENVLLVGWNPSETVLAVALWFDPTSCEDCGSEGGVGGSPTTRFLTHDTLSGETRQIDPGVPVWGWVTDDALLTSRTEFAGGGARTQFHSFQIATGDSTPGLSLDNELLAVSMDPKTRRLAIVTPDGARNSVRVSGHQAGPRLRAVADEAFGAVQELQIYRDRVGYARKQDPTNLRSPQELVVNGDAISSCRSAIGFAWINSRKLLVRCGNSVEVARR